MKKAQILFSKPARRILTKQQGGRILEIKTGLCKASQGSYLEW